MSTEHPRASLGFLLGDKTEGKDSHKSQRRKKNYLILNTVKSLKIIESLEHLFLEEDIYKWN